MMQQDNRNISRVKMTREANQAYTSILYQGLVGKYYISLNSPEPFETVPGWSHVRRCAAVKDPFGSVGFWRIVPYVVIHCRLSYYMS
jgi:hypothetical protein